MRVRSQAEQRLLESTLQDSRKLFGRLKKLRAQKKATRSTKKGIEKLLERYLKHDLRAHPVRRAEIIPEGDPVHGRHVIYWWPDD